MLDTQNLELKMILGFHVGSGTFQEKLVLLIMESSVQSSETCFQKNELCG